MSYTVSDFEIDKNANGEPVALGSGSYATVYRGRHKITGELVAIKQIHRKKLSEPKIRECIDREISIMQSIHDEHIVRLYCADKKPTEYTLVLELCNPENFAEYLSRQKQLSEERAKFFMKQLAEGLRSLREHSFIHRDLKPANLLLKSGPAGADDLILKITDFGFARELETEDLAQTVVGTPFYIAPEIVFHNGGGYTDRIDLWSVGIIFFQMLFGRVPYIGRDVRDLVDRIPHTRLNLDKANVTPQCKDLLERLLRYDPLERITWDDFFTHPWLELNVAGPLRTPVWKQRPPQPAEKAKALLSSADVISQFASCGQCDEVNNYWLKIKALNVLREAWLELGHPTDPAAQQVADLIAERFKALLVPLGAIKEPAPLPEGTIETILFNHAKVLGKNGSSEELTGKFEEAKQHYENGLAVLQVLMRDCLEDADRQTIQKLIDMLSRRLNAIKIRV